jgi:polysaccharide deacetylase 2 family uncharacterized protein YibQ
MGAGKPQGLGQKSPLEPVEKAPPANAPQSLARQKQSSLPERGPSAAGPLSAGGKSAITPPERIHKGKGKLIIVIDDVGQNTFQLKPFLRFPGPITFAILPNLPYSQEAAKLITAAGKKYIVHQPVQPLNKLDPGPGALYVSMKPDAMRAALAKNFATLPGAVGMNNHEGSLGTKDLTLMREILRFCKGNKLYFLDSKTIGGTATREAAKAENYSFWERDVFLDNKPDRASIEEMFNDGLKKAERNGRAIMIGHVWTAELAQLLMDLYPELVDAGYSLSDISQLVLSGENDASFRN